MAQTNIAGALSRKGENQAALELFQECEKVFRKHTATAHLINNLTNIGQQYHHMANYPPAKKYYAEALDLSKKLGSKRLTANIHNTIGLLYKAQKKLDSAYYYQELAYNEYTEIGAKSPADRSLRSLALIRYEQNDIEEAEAMAREALKGMMETGRNQDVPRTSNIIGMCKLYPLDLFF